MTTKPYEPKERPILFSGEMVRAILAGRKTQTRRVVKPQYTGDKLVGPEWYTSTITRRGELCDGPFVFGVYNAEGDYGATCPYGAPCDRLWVRETWTPDHAAFYPHHRYTYRADRGFDYERNERGEVYSDEAKAWYPFRWRPSIHMPRHASRLSLAIRMVRVERLHDITDADAVAEGIEQAAGFGGKRWRDYTGEAQSLFNPVNSFCSLWQSINGPESWDANPWVWVLEFERVTDA